MSFCSFAQDKSLIVGHWKLQDSVAAKNSELDWVNEKLKWVKATDSSDTSPYGVNFELKKDGTVEVFMENGNIVPRPHKKFPGEVNTRPGKLFWDIKRSILTFREEGNEEPHFRMPIYKAGDKALLTGYPDE
jgi:hypothetical protein